MKYAMARLYVSIDVHGLANLPIYYLTLHEKFAGKKGSYSSHLLEKIQRGANNAGSSTVFLSLKFLYRILQ